MGGYYEIVNEPTDAQLLRSYAERSEEAAFAELVRRHIDFVHSAARRMAGDAHVAEDVTQGVFVALAKNASQLAGRAVLAGWLHRTAQNIAAQSVRTDVRRRRREQEAAAMNELLSAEPEASWERIAPHLDAALGELDDPDRDAVFLRYFKNCDLRTVGATLGISDDAAQKRVSRAVERLREFLAKRGVTVGAGGLVVVISASAVQAAPAGLAAVISTKAITGAATTTIISATKTIAMTTLQKTLIGATVAVLAGAGVYEAHQAAQMRDEVQTFQQQQASLAEQVRQLQRERDDATNRAAALSEEMAKNQSNLNELLRLRSEVTALKRGQAGSQSAANAPVHAGPVNANANANTGPSPEERGRKLGEAVVRGDAGAFSQFLAEARAEQASFKTNRTGLDQQQEGEVAGQTFAPINTAFKIIDDAAGTGSRPAIDALAQALQNPDLREWAVSSLGGLAANGDPTALDMLTHPAKYGVLLASTVSALKPAADNGNQTAIDALAAVANDSGKQPLWYLTAQSLSAASAAGNPTATDGLINISHSTNQFIQGVAITALRAAAANQNAKAAQALQTLPQ